MQKFVSAYAVLIRRKSHLLVRLTMPGRILWRSYPADMPEAEAVMRAARHLATAPPQEVADIRRHAEPSLRVAWWGRL